MTSSNFNSAINCSRDDLPSSIHRGRETPSPIVEEGSAVALVGLCVITTFIAAMTGALGPTLAGALTILAGIGGITCLGRTAMRDDRTLHIEIEAGDKRAVIAIGRHQSEGPQHRS